MDSPVRFLFRHGFRLLLLLLFVFIAGKTATPQDDSESPKAALRAYLAERIEEDPFANATGQTLSLDLFVHVITIMNVEEGALVVAWEAKTSVVHRLPRGAWDPADFGGLTWIHVNKAWSPRIQPCMSRGWKLIDEDAIKYKVYHNGTIETAFNIQTEGRCRMNFAQYPHDLHRCVICFRHASTDYAVQMRIVVPPGVTLVSNSQYEIRKARLVKNYTDDQSGVVLNQLAVEVEFTRNAQFYELTIILPMSLVSMAVLVSLVFNTDRVNLFLAASAIFGSIFTFFLSLTLPKQQKLPALGWYLAALFVLIAVATALHIAINYYLRDEEEEEENRAEDNRMIEFWNEDDAAAVAFGETAVRMRLIRYHPMVALRLFFDVILAFLSKQARKAARKMRTVARRVTLVLSLLTILVLHAVAFWSQEALE